MNQTDDNHRGLMKKNGVYAAYLRRILLTMFMLGLLVPLSAAAISLDEAKNQGLVGEKPDGYLGVVRASPEVDRLANDINQKRRERYTEIAKQNGTGMIEVEVLAGKTAIENTAPGKLVLRPDGSWVKK